MAVAVPTISDQGADGSNQLDAQDKGEQVSHHQESEMIGRE